MLFLVTSEFELSSIPTEPKQRAAFSELVLIPSLEMITTWEKDGTILGGGIHAGGHKTAYIVEASSVEELSANLQSMPAWTFSKIETIPLESAEYRVSQIRERVEQLKVPAGK